MTTPSRSPVPESTAQVYRDRLTPSRRAKAALWVCFAAVVAGVLLIVLDPERPAAASQDWLRLWIDRAHSSWLPDFITFALVEWLANVVMFVPLGFLATLLFRRWWLLLPGALFASGAMELLQSILLPARVGSWLDIAANFAGAVIGCGLGAGAISLQQRWIGRRINCVSHV